MFNRLPVKTGVAIGNEDKMLNSSSSVIHLGHGAGQLTQCRLAGENGVKGSATLLQLAFRREDSFPGEMNINELYTLKICKRYKLSDNLGCIC